MPDGTISGTGMNSLNHYAYGAIAEWMYRSIAGINPAEEAPGFRRIELAPKPDFRLRWVKAKVDSATGTYKSEWSFDDEGRLEFRFEIPFNATARLRLPRAAANSLELEGPALAATAEQLGEDAVIELDSGCYVIRYTPTRSYIKLLSTHTPLADLVANEGARAFIASLVPPGIDLNPDTLRLMIGDASPRELAVYYPMDEAFLDDLDAKLKAIS
jgi:alpha-L-rhamnosidase